MTACAPFAETSYGVVKRLATIERWIDETTTALGKPALDILDFGCGTGELLTVPLARGGHRVTGVDSHGPTVREARRRHPVAGLDFIVADLARLQSSATLYDAVICSEVIEHVDDPEAFLRAFRGLLRSGGVLIVTTPNGYGSFEVLRRLEHILRATGIHPLLRHIVWLARKGLAQVRGVDAPAAPLHTGETPDDIGFLNLASTHVQFFRASALERIFANAGFAVVERRSRTLLCGPYVDALFRFMPLRERALIWNASVADRLPFTWAADWMYLLRPREAVSAC